jgi:hypothetical protein
MAVGWRPWLDGPTLQFLQVRRVQRTLSVAVRAMGGLGACVHGHMADSVAAADAIKGHLRSSGTTRWFREQRSVKPSAQPTLVRTQHLPPPAETARWLRILVAGGPFFSVPACVTLCRCRPLCRGVHGRIADGFGALERSVRTVGCFTDGHGRDAVAARSPACSNAKGGGFQLVGAAPSPAAATICGTSITRPHDRGPDRTADHRRRPPAWRPPQGVRRHQPARLTWAPGMPRSGLLLLRT